MDWLMAMAQGGQMLLVAIPAFIAGLGLIALGRRQAEPGPPLASIFADDRGAATFLFDGRRLIDCSPEARAILSRHRGDGAPGSSGPDEADWFALVTWLGLLFPGIAARIDGLPSEGRFVLSSPPDAVQPLTVAAELRSGIMRVEVRDSDLPAPAAPQATGLLAEEVDLLRRMAALSPVLVWREDAEGAVVWGNAVYLMAAATSLPPGAALGWPLPRLFPVMHEATATPTRLSLPQADGTGWFDVTLRPDAEGWFGYASAADAAAQAILRGIAARRPVIRVGAARALPALRALAPWLGARLLRGA